MVSSDSMQHRKRDKLIRFRVNHTSDNSSQQTNDPCFATEILSSFDHKLDFGLFFCNKKLVKLPTLSTITIHLN